MSAHTPGPWLVDANNCHAGQIAVCHGDDEGYAEVWSENWMTEGRRSQFANARLIAAAPDLLTALQAAVDHSFGDFMMPSKIEKAAREAIFKATGAIERVAERLPDALYAEPQEAAAPVPVNADLLEMVIGLKRLIELAAAGRHGAQHSYLESRAGHFVQVADALEKVDLLIAKATRSDT